MAAFCSCLRPFGSYLSEDSAAAEGHGGTGLASESPAQLPVVCAPDGNIQVGQRLPRWADPKGAEMRDWRKKEKG